MSKIIISASLAIAAVNAFASVSERVDVAKLAGVDAVTAARIDAVLNQREVRAKVGGMQEGLMANLSKDGVSLWEQFPPGNGEMIAWSDDSASSPIGGTCYGNCYSNTCYSNCYSNCYGDCYANCHWACHSGP